VKVAPQTPLYGNVYLKVNHWSILRCRGNIQTLRKNN